MISLTDRAGRFVKFKLKPSDAADAETSELLADKAYDSNTVRELLASRGIIATIPPKSNRREPIYHDPVSYKGGTWWKTPLPTPSSSGAWRPATAS